MEDTLPVALGITAIGMTLLFLALGLIYGLLALLTAVVRDPSAAVEPADVAAAVGTAAAASNGRGAARQRAAVAAVALARAEAEAGPVEVVSGSDRGDVASAGGWWALHHGRRLAAPPSPWRGR